MMSPSKSPVPRSRTIREALHNAFAAAALKGNAYAFQQLADGAYGKLKERVEYEVSKYREVSEKAHRRAHPATRTPARNCSLRLEEFNRVNGLQHPPTAKNAGQAQKA
jgi:hypothetical protein